MLIDNSTASTGEVIAFFTNVVLGVGIAATVMLAPAVLVLAIFWFAQHAKWQAGTVRLFKILFKIYGWLLGVVLAIFILRTVLAAIL